MWGMSSEQRGGRLAVSTSGGAHLDAGGAALAHGVGHGGARRVDHGHEAHEAQVVRLEVNVVRVERKALRELVLGQEDVAETWEEEEKEEEAEEEVVVVVEEEEVEKEGVEEDQG